MENPGIFSLAVQHWLGSVFHNSPLFCAHLHEMCRNLCAAPALAGAQSRFLSLRRAFWRTLPPRVERFNDCFPQVNLSRWNTPERHFLFSLPKVGIYCRLIGIQKLNACVGTESRIRVVLLHDQPRESGSGPFWHVVVEEMNRWLCCLLPLMILVTIVSSCITWNTLLRGKVLEAAEQWTLDFCWVSFQSPSL